MLAFWWAHEEMRREGGRIITLGFEGELNPNRALALISHAPQEQVELVKILHLLGFPDGDLASDLIFVDAMMR